MILVHPFKKTKRYGIVLEEWSKNSTHTIPHSTTRAFSFNLHEILIEGRKGLEKVSRRLQKNIKQLAPKLPLSPEDVKGPTTGETLPHKPPSIIFIAHSIGAWVVKDTLAYWTSGNIPFDTTGVIFVDAPDVISATEHLYSNYLDSVSQKFSTSRLQYPAVRQPSTLNYLCDIDVNFKKFENSAYIQTAANESHPSLGSKSLPVRYLNIWISEVPLLDQVLIEKLPFLSRSLAYSLLD